MQLFMSSLAEAASSAPASDDINSHPELSGWRSPRMSVMRVIVLHPYTKFEIRIDFPGFGRGVNRPGDLDL